MQLIDFVIFCTTTATFLWQQKKVQHQKLLCYQETTDDSKLKQALAENKTLNATEKVCTVTAENVPTPNGHLRSQMRLQKLWHRATYIIVRHIEESNDNNDNNDNDESKDNMDSWYDDDDDDDDNTFLLIQRRSNIKDYCPGKLDPTPGGVVGYNESYQDNAIREIEEEMNIQVDIESSDATSSINGKNTITRYFTFPYQDEKVKVWGELYEVIYRGSLSNIVIQPEEVSEVKRLSLNEIQSMIESNPDDWMPDGLYALKLYLQRKADMKVKKRLLKEYSSGDLNRYFLRPKPKVIFFDCDDCLYFDGWKLANELTAKIEEWCTTKKQLPKGKAYELYKEHGTALRGLLAEGLIENNEEAIDGFLKDVHDIPIHKHLEKDEKLRKMILAIDPSIPKYIFTASVRHHAERCLKALGIDDLFVDIIDVKTCKLATKHSREAFEAAMAHVGVIEPECCLFLDDSTKNIAAARNVGWRSILVGTVGRDCGKPITTEHAEHEIDRIHDMPSILPELFR